MIQKTKILSLMIVFMVIGISANAQWKNEKANEDTEIFRYDIECEGIAKLGSKLVKVWSYSKNPKHAISHAMKNAVHGIIFKGFAGGGQGCTSFSPLMKSAQNASDHAAFFDAFFADGGDYLRYVLPLQMETLRQVTD